MKAFPKQIEARRQEILARLNEKSESISALIVQFNDLIREWTERIDSACNDYNAAVEDAVTLRDEASQAIRDYIDRKSEKWQESDRAGLYESWADTIEGLSLDPVDGPSVDPIDEPEFVALIALEDEWAEALPE